MLRALTLAAVVIVVSGSAVADTDETTLHAGPKVIMRYRELIKKGEIEAAKKLELRDPRLRLEDRDRFRRDLQELSQTQRLLIRECWKMSKQIVGATNSIHLRPDRKNVLVLIAKESEGEWFVASQSVHSPERWAKTRARIQDEGGTRIYESKSVE